MFVLIDTWTLTLKKCWKKSFSYETKASMSLILMRKMCLWHPIINRKEISYESMFVQIDRRSLILKMVESKTFFMKLKHQCHLSEWVERAYGAQTWKKRQLLCESVFVLIDTQTLFLKNDWNKGFSFEIERS